ncbi:MAG: STAS domain-containing protein [Candidatus Xenobia bacterium]
MSPEVVVSHTQAGDRHVVVRVQGDLDLETSIDVESVIKGYLTLQRPFLLLDAMAIGAVDSIGLAVLLRISRRARRMGGNMALICQQTRLLRLLEITGLDRVFPVFPDVGSAMQQEAAPAL